MACVVLQCKSHADTQEYNIEHITFHRFPNDNDLRQRWIDIISRKDWTPNKHSRVCSKHFEEDCIITKGWRRIKPGAVPTLHLGHSSNVTLTDPMQLMKEECVVSEVSACRACLATDARLYDVTECGLQEAFDKLAGVTISTLNGVHLCLLCCSELSKYAAFRDRCQRVHELLATLQEFGPLKMDDIKAIDRDSHKLTRNLVTTGAEIIDTNECFINIFDSDSETKIIDDLSTPIKPEKNHTESVDTNFKELNEESGDSYEIVSIEEIQIKNSEMTEIIEPKKERTTLKKRKSLDKSEVSTRATKIDTGNSHDIKKQEKKPTALKKRKSLATSNVSTEAAKIDIGNSEDIEKQEKKPKKRKAAETNPSNIKKKRGKWKEYIKIGDEIYPDFDYEAFENEFKVKIELLSKAEQEKELEARKLTSNYLKSPHRCDMCGKGYSHMTTFTNHMAYHDHSNGPIECEICHFRFATQKQYKNHRMLHRLRFTCQECGLVSRLRSNARNHFEMHAGKTHKCPHCPRTFARAASCCNHARIAHPGLNVACDLCGETFLSAYGIKLHKNKAHRENIKHQDFKCPTCDVNFNNLAALDKHTSTAPDCHTAVTPCAVCGANCESEAALSEHTALRHPPDQYRCHECDATFSSAAAFETHHRRKHLGQQRRKSQSSRPRAPNTPRETIVCETCGKIVQSETQLKYHRRLHDKPFKCTHCPKSFAGKHSRDNHLITHTGERPFQCKECPVAFSFLCNLKRHHQVVHLNQRKSFPCSLCGKTFSAKAHMQLHIKTVHNHMPWPKRKRRRKEQADNGGA